MQKVNKNKRVGEIEYKCRFALSEECEIYEFMPKDYQECWCTKDGKKDENLCTHFIALRKIEKLENELGTAFEPGLNGGADKSLKELL